MYRVGLNALLRQRRDSKYSGQTTLDRLNYMVTSVKNALSEPTHVPVPTPVDKRRPGPQRNRPPQLPPVAPTFDFSIEDSDGGEYEAFYGEPIDLPGGAQVTIHRDRGMEVHVVRNMGHAPKAVTFWYRGKSHAYLLQPGGLAVRFEEGYHQFTYDSGFPEIPEEMLQAIAANASDTLVGLRARFYPTDPNEGGGFLVYPNQEWMNCTPGLQIAAEWARLYANCITTAFDYDNKPDSFIGVDESRGYVDAEWYGKDGVVSQLRAFDGGPRELDFEHLSRITTPLFRLAKNGYGWASQVFEIVLEGVIQKWCRRNVSDGKSHMVSWWSAFGFLEHTKPGLGTEHMGRNTGHALTALAYGYELGMVEDSDIDLVVKMVEHMIVPGHSVVHMLHYNDPINGAKSNAWDDKFNKYEHSIPSGTDLEDIQLTVGFEEIIIAWGIEMLSEAGALDESSDLYHRVHSRIQHNPYQLTVFYNGLLSPRWSDTRPSTWSSYYLGDLDGDEYIGDKSTYASNPLTIVPSDFSRILGVDDEAFDL